MRRKCCNTCRFAELAVHHLWAFCYRWDKNGQVLGLRLIGHEIGCPHWEKREKEIHD